LADGGGTGAGIGSWTGADLDLANNFRQVLRQLIMDEHERIVTLDRSIDTARAAWLEARSRLRAVQTLHDRHRTQVRAEQTRLDQRELDERAGTRRPTSRELPAGPKVGVR
jgi:flagellar export protein FliJ